MAGSQRNVSVKFTAEISNFRRAMEEAAQATTKAKKASEDAGKAADQSAEEIKKQALAHHAAAKAAGLQYDNTGQLVTMNGKAVSSQQAAAHGLQTFSKEAYLAGRAAVSAGDDAEKSAKLAAEAEAKAAAAIEKRREAMERVGAIAMTVGVATLAGVGLAIKSYTDFDKQMSSVDAATHETAGNMDLLRKAAIEAGADTAFSASDAAKGIEEMAKAGVSTADILGGGLKGTLALAAAGALGVGEASEIAASAMVQFGLKGKDIPHIADLLAAGAGKAQGSVQDMGLALSYAGVPAAGLGVSIEQTTGTIAMLAKAGIVGEKAGTALRAMLVSMVKPSKETKTAMEDLGITFSDANGEFIGLDGAAQVLKDRLGGLDEMTRNATLAQIFGNEALGAAQTLYNNGAAGVQEMTAAVNDYGYATDTARRMQDNLAGDIEKLGGSFDTVLIQSGSGANEVLRGLVKNLEGVVDAVGKIPAPVLSAGVGLVALVGGAALVGGTLITVIPKIRDTRDALNELAPAGGKARNALDKVGAAATGLAALGTATVILAKLAEADYMSKIDTGMGKVAGALAEVTTNGPGAATALDGIFKDRDGGDLIRGVDDLNTAMQRTFNKNRDQEFNDFGESMVNFATGFKGSSHILEDSFGRVDKSLAGLVAGGKAEDAAKAFDKIEAAAKIQGATVEELAAKFPEYSDALNQAEADAKNAGEGGDKAAAGIKAVGDASGEAAPSAEDVAEALAEVGVNADGSVADLAKFTEALLNAGLIQLSARDAARGWSQALLDMGLQADGTGGKIGSLGTAFDNTTAQGIKNQAMFDGVAQAGIRNAEAMAKSGASNEALQGNLNDTYKGLVAAAGQFGITGTEAETLARKVLGVPDGVSITSWMSDEAKRMADATKKAVDDIPTSKNVGIHVQYTESGTAIRDRAGDAGMSTKVQVYQTGGRLPGYADGGQLPMSGPGTDTRDGFLGISSAGVPMARVDAGEWIINRGSSDRYNRELAAINAGTFPKLPGYAGGGRHEYSARDLGYGPTRSVSGAPGSVTNNWNISEQTDARVTAYEVARRQQKLSA